MTSRIIMRCGVKGPQDLTHVMRCGVKGSQDLTDIRRSATNDPISVLLYGSEAWVTTLADRRRLDVLDKRCQRRLLRVFWHISNQSIREVKRDGMVCFFLFLYIALYPVHWTAQSALQSHWCNEECGKGPENITDVMRCGSKITQDLTDVMRCGVKGPQDFTDVMRSGGRIIKYHNIDNGITVCVFVLYENDLELWTLQNTWNKTNAICEPHYFYLDIHAGCNKQPVSKTRNK